MTEASQVIQAGCYAVTQCKDQEIQCLCNQVQGQNFGNVNVRKVHHISGGNTPSVDCIYMLSRQHIQ